MAQLDDLRAAAIEALGQAISLLKDTELDDAMKARGWTPELAGLVAEGMTECRTRIEAGWTPPARSGGQWIRLMMDSIDTNDDPLLQAVSQGGAAVSAFGNAAEASE